jgi:hypothetical protein
VRRRRDITRVQHLAGDHAVDDVSKFQRVHARIALERLFTYRTGTFMATVPV